MASGARRSSSTASSGLAWRCHAAWSGCVCSTPPMRATSSSAFADRRIMHVIASDGGYLSRPVAVESVLVAPGERYEVLVDFADGRPIDLVALPEADRPMAQMPGMKTMARQTDRVAILRFVPEDSLACHDAPRPRSARGVRRAGHRRASGAAHFVLDDMSAANMPRLMEAGARRDGRHGIIPVTGHAALPRPDRPSCRNGRDWSWRSRASRSRWTASMHA